MSMVIPPKDEHQHVLPYCHLVRVRTLASCATCGEWFFARYQYQGFGGANIWQPVLWFHWRLRRIIRLKKP